MTAIVAERAGLNAAGVEALSAQREEPTWFLDLRRRAWRFFEEIPWPTSNDEVWRRTRLTGLAIDEFHLAETPGPVAADRTDLSVYLRDELESIESAGDAAKAVASTIVPSRRKRPLSARWPLMALKIDSVR